MLVKVKKRGIHGSRRWKPGMEFDLSDPSQFNASWMEKVEVKRGPGRPKKATGATQTKTKTD